MINDYLLPVAINNIIILFSAGRMGTQDERINMSYSQDVERSISKKFRSRLWGPFIRAIRDYDLIQENDVIGVCISGGKDSMCMAKMFQMLQRHSEVPFEVVYMVMDPGYSPANRQRIEENAAKLEIPVRIFETNIFDVAYDISASPCYMCAKMRRGALYRHAREFGCNKIALGHHFNDVIETTLLGMFYASKLEAMIPKLHSQNYEGMELIRPMYCIREEDVIAWSQYNGLEFLQCACKFTEENKDLGGEGSSKRQAMKELVRKLREDNPDIDKSIFNAIHRVCIETFPGYKIGKEVHSFLEHYDREKEKE